MLSHKRLFVFVHVPRTAGTSIEAALAAHSDYPTQNYDVPREYAKHATAQQIRDAIGERFYDYARFAFVRNPWDRLVSLYHWGSQLANDPQWKSFATFDAWVDGYFLRRRLYEKWGPQVALLTCDGHVAMSYVGRFESLADDWQFVCNLIGVDDALPHKYGTKREGYRDYYDSRTRKVVEDHYGADITAFSYDF